MAIHKGESSIEPVARVSGMREGIEIEQDAHHALVKRHHHDCHDCGYAVVPVYQPVVYSYCDDHHDHHHC
ncbi:hypothetical protein PCANC_02694 [Puccinia coronata f. sp. avenae]|uniref:Uncharacterized protein n=1 Tax=Puccinia coronata f. sp. avenae TaxID=200324 RepID=A0A2N5S4H9_9BASI|nr:hypothetical protein PCANC_22629 [Puccinia coronata f. sp. avenae]PLW54956.1 hypothetical protein PCANC_02694 [Puccinia coronata f. sp. avenae]